MEDRTTDVLICGAGVAGISTAYHLLKANPSLRLLLVDEHPPLSLTSDKSGECYRNFWPGPEPSMVKMMNRSIDILETLAAESDNIFNMNRRGYVFATAQPEKAESYRLAALSARENGAGPLRIHDRSNGGANYHPPPAQGFEGQPDGADVFLDGAVIQKFFPEISESAVGLLHIRRAGWLSAQQLGMYLLQKAQRAGLTVLRDKVDGIFIQGGRVQGVRLAGEGLIETDVFVNAAGPFIQHISRMMDLNLPVFNELHLKASIHDHLGIVPRGVPMLIWSDPQRLDWPEDAREFLAESEETRRLLDEFPSGVHTRPEGAFDSDILLLLWEYNSGNHPVEFPIPLDPEFPEIALRGICKIVPAMNSYLNRLPKPVLDGGYYTKTKENRPLACPLPVKGAYLIGALSGFGIMASSGMGELLAAHIRQSQLPDYASAFDLNRYSDPDYLSLLENWGDSWQL